jgi:hypothetical protein
MDISVKEKFLASVEVQTQDLPDRILLTTLTELIRPPAQPVPVTKY